MAIKKAGKNCGFNFFLHFRQFYFAISFSKCLCDIPFAQFQLFGTKKKQDTWLLSGYFSPCNIVTDAF